MIPKNFQLYQNFPNPFNPVTKIKYEIKANGKSERVKVKLIIYDIAGKELKVLVNQEQNAGIYEVNFDGRELPSGIYFYRFETEDYLETKKMVLVK
jgi:5-hydroxyisourate hydrolase-like protein (transthyretin family)